LDLSFYLDLHLTFDQRVVFASLNAYLNLSRDCIYLARRSSLYPIAISYYDYYKRQLKNNVKEVLIKVIYKIALQKNLVRQDLSDVSYNIMEN